MDQIIESGRTGIDFIKRQAIPGACVYVIKGVTGVSKSVTVKRTLAMFGSQVIQHGAIESALWRCSTQIVYLYVAMAHDGSRGGLLTAILLAVDDAVGTNYAVELPKRFRTIERQAGAIISLLHTYYLGVLVIDECQLRNLVQCEHADKMQLFLLNLINAGIPLVLVGNPAGFSWFSSLSQDGSRMAEIPQAFFHPCGAVGNSGDDEWETVFSGIRAYYVLDNSPDNEEECSLVLRRCSGGIPRLALTLWCHAQREIMLGGRNSMTKEDIFSAYTGDGFSEMRSLADGFAMKDPALLLRWRDEDIPVDFYAKIWGKQLPTSNLTSELLVESISPPVSGQSKARSEQSKLKAQQTRENNKQAKRAELTAALTDDDMRKNGIVKHTLDSLDAMLAQINAPNGDLDVAAVSNGTQPAGETPASNTTIPNVPAKA